MSSRGNRFGHETGVLDRASNVWTYTQQLRGLDDTVSLELSESLNDSDLSIEDHRQLYLSADGTRAAVARGYSTNVYENGVLIKAFRGKPVAWFDDNRLLVATYGTWHILDSSGNLQPASKVPAADGFVYDAQIVSANEVYSPRSGAIYSPITGEKLWSCQGAGTGAAAANYVVFSTRDKVVFDRY